MARRSRRSNGPSYSDDAITTGLIYTRVSSDEQRREGLSLPAQLRECRRYCADRGWLIGGEWQDVMTGTRDDRPSYQAMLAEARRLAREGKPVSIVVLRLDRLGRRLKERVIIRDELKELGVQTHSVREGGHVNDMMAMMLASLAEQEVERLGERIRDVRDEVEVNGWHVPGRPAFGYRWRDATAEERRAGAPKVVLIPDEHTAPVVREAFRRVADGETPRAVALWLAGLPEEARGTVTRTVKGDDGTTHTETRPRVIHHSAVRLMLTSAVYCGRYEGTDGEHQGGRGRWQALVDQPTWNAVQLRMQSKARGPVSGRHLLTSVLRCPRCGGRMSGWTTGGRTVGGAWKRYRCASFGEGGERAVRNCTYTVAAMKLDADTLRQVSDLLAPLAQDDPELRRAMERTWQAMRKPNDQQSRDRARRAARARQDVKDAKRRIGEATRRLTDGDITLVAYRAMVEQETQRLESAERTLAAPEIASAGVPSLPAFSDVIALIGGWQAILTGEQVPAQRELLALLVEKVTPVRLRYGVYAARISWTPEGNALRDIAGSA